MTSSTAAPGRIGVIAAMAEECVHLRDRLGDPAPVEHLGMRIDRRTRGGIEVGLIESGIGKVNATLATEWMARDFGPDLIVNTGSAGGIDPTARIGDVVIADRVVHRDVDVTPIGLGFGELPGLPAHYPIEPGRLAQLIGVVEESGVRHHIGSMATGDSFVYRRAQVDEITTNHGAVAACDMEAAAVAQVCHLRAIDLVVLRTLSDVAGAEAPENFAAHLDQAGRTSAQLVLSLIDRLGGG